MWGINVASGTTRGDGHNSGKEDGGGGYACSCQSLGLENGATRENMQ